MAPTHGSKAELFLNGVVITTFFKTCGLALNRDKAETSTFRATTKSYVAGLNDATATLEGYFDVPVDAQMAAWVNGTDEVLSYFPYGSVPGISNVGYSILAQSSKYEVKTDVGTAAEVSVELSASKDATGTGLDRGFVAVTNQVVAASGNSASFDGGASSSAGAAFIVHGQTTGGTLTVTLEDSADNSSWAAVSGASLSFTGGSVPSPATDGKRDVVSGTIRRYTRLAWTGAGTIVLGMISRK